MQLENQYMKNKKLDDRETAIKSAMISAILLVAEMDMALDVGCAEVIADDIMRKLEEFAPLSISDVTRFGLRERLLAHVTTYGRLRTIAPEFLDLETYLESRRKVFFDDLLYVLDADEWIESHPEFYWLIISITNTVERILDDRYSIPF
jgi:hypothetical protein